MAAEKIDLGYVLMALADEALEFAVNVVDRSNSTDDPLNRISVMYNFIEERPNKSAGERRAFSVKVSKNFCTVHGIHHPDTHDKAIRFGLASYPQNPQSEEFILTTEAYDELKEKHMLAGRELREEILKKIFVINRQWPTETFTRFNAGDNLFGDEQEISDWLQDLKNAGDLIKGTAKVNQRRGHTTGGYLINPQAYTRIEKELADAQTKVGVSKTTGKPLLFLSYSTKDRLIAGQIRSELEKHSCTVFLAHEDITPTREFVIEIRNTLDQCHVFLPLLTNEFSQSDWTAQEAGIAIAKRKLIVPIKIDIDPPGFMSSIQAILFKDDDLVGSCKRISEVIRNELDSAQE